MKFQVVCLGQELLEFSLEKYLYFNQYVFQLVLNEMSDVLIYDSCMNW